MRKIGRRRPGEDRKTDGGERGKKGVELTPGGEGPGTVVVVVKDPTFLNQCKPNNHSFGCPDKASFCFCFPLFSNFLFFLLKKLNK